MRYGSVCSGIEAATVAWHDLGFEAAWYSEIEKFPSRVLAHHYPEVPNLGDMTALPQRILDREVEAPDLLVGGTPCQAFSIAGLRLSLGDARGNLTLTFVRLADAIDSVRVADGKPGAIVLWENVPGVLSTKDNAFGCFLAGLAGAGEALVPARGKWPRAGVVHGGRRRVAWAVLDAQYFGVAQRRRRVFVVAIPNELVEHLGDRVHPAEILSIGESLRRDTPTRRQAGEGLAPAVSTGASFSCTGNKRVEADAMVVARSLRGRANASHREDSDTYIPTRGQDPVVAIYASEKTSALCAADGPKGVSDQYAHEGKLIAMSGGMSRQDAESETLIVHTLRAQHDASEDGTGRGTPLVAQPVIMFEPRCTRTTGGQPQEELAHCLRADLNSGDGAPCVNTSMAVRRLTPRECERLQGFPDDYTAIPGAADGNRYKALGNSMAVPVMRWIGHRIHGAVA